MRDCMTLKEAAAELEVSSTSTVRRILSLNTKEGHRAAHFGYDSRGRQLVRTDVVKRKARERAHRGNWRVANLGAWATRREEPIPPTDV